MRYPGSKRRIATQILDVILERRGDRDIYVEPFLGGANSFSVIAPHFTHSAGIELNPDLIACYQAVADGWEPPGVVSEAEYQRLRTNFDPKEAALRGFVATGCSFGGKWWGGYARGKKYDGVKVSFAGESSRALGRQRSALASAQLVAASYTKVNKLKDLARAVIYCDPPYAGTTDGYSGSGFDSAAFWLAAECWQHGGALVFVSEYKAPAGWSSVWEQELKNKLAGEHNSFAAVEKLWMFDVQ